jgi:hypothetical protein
MGVTLDVCGAAFQGAFKFTDAECEPVVELLLLDEQGSFSGERCLNAGEFFGELSDERLLGASDARFGVCDAALDLLEIAEHSASALGVEAEEVAFVDHGAGLGSGSESRTEGKG